MSGVTRPVFDGDQPGDGESEGRGLAGVAGQRRDERAGGGVPVRRLPGPGRQSVHGVSASLNEPAGSQFYCSAVSLRTVLSLSTVMSR